MLITGSIDIEAIKDQYPLASIIEQHVALKRRSGLLEGLCPFHSERTPSFKIYESDQRYHCFGCGAHGDIFDFLREMEGLDIREAAERITGGVALPVYNDERIAELRAKAAAREAEEAAQRQKAIAQATERWMAADPGFLDHPYLETKKIQPHGARREGDLLLIPLMGMDGKIQTLQSIDKDGRKLFISDAPVSGGFFIIGGKVVSAEGPVILCEGFATAASIHEATGAVTVCAFNAGNMTKVADILAGKYPDKDYLVAGDDDRFKKNNVGREKAIEAAAILKCRAVLPAFPEDSQGTDFNDMAADYGIATVKALLIDGELPSGEAADPVDGSPDDVFPLLDINELESLPPPTWLIDELIADHGLSIVYGDPGAGKSFITLDMALRLAHGMDWHGMTTNPCGVLYIAGEGARGFGKRVKGWRKEHAQTMIGSFLLLPTAVQLLDQKDREKLCRTIDKARLRVNFDIRLTVVDTVSRSIAGQDENGQESMSMFVEACGIIQSHTGGAVIGVHHAGKDSSRGMRGSTVLLGGCDASLKITKSEQQRVTIEVEKQKDAEEAAPIYMEMKKIEWETGLVKPTSTLVPVKSTEPLIEQKRLSRHQIEQIFDEIDRAWVARHAWSVWPNAKRSGRYLPAWVTSEFGVPETTAVDHLTSWQQHGYLALECYDQRNKAQGLRVIKRLERD